MVGLAVAILVLPTRPPFSEAPLDYLFDATTGLVIVVAGLVAWSRRPGHRTGPLLVLAGYLWYVGSLYELVPAGTLVPLLGFAFRGYYDPHPGVRHPVRPGRSAEHGTRPGRGRDPGRDPGGA